MTRRTVLPPLTIGSLARNLVANAGQPMDALRCYESLVALWVRCCDTGRPGAAGLRMLTSRAAQLLAAGEDTLTAPGPEAIPRHLLDDESLVRLSASLAVQGVEWPDAVALADKWLKTRTESGFPVRVMGVRTGGAYLAPLVAAGLAAAGVDVELAGVRPGEHHPAPGERRVLLVDDPPLTGRTLAALATELAGPSGVEVLVPLFAASDVQGLRDAGVAVTVLPRDRWQSTRRLAPEALSAYLDARADWTALERPVAVDGFEPGRENSAHRLWPGLRRRSPARAAVRLRTPAGVRKAVIGWIPPGIFGDAARTAATGLDSPVPPATYAVAPSLVVTEDVTPASPLRDAHEHRVDEAVDYVLARAQQLPLTTTASSPPPAVVRTVAQALAGSPDQALIGRLHRLLTGLGPALPDNRCEAEKWLIDEAGRLRKTGHLTHAYRRDNELLTPLVDLAALTVAFGCGLHKVADLLDQRSPRQESWLDALATALLCYGAARGEQIPRTYNPQRAAETALEAHRLQRGMADAAQHLLAEQREAPGRTAPSPGGSATATPRVVHRWQRAPAALVQPQLPFGRPPADPAAPGGLPPDLEKAVAAWACDFFHPVRSGRELLLAPLGPPATWPQAAAALDELAERLPDPGRLAWCGVPLVSLEVAS